MITGNDDLIIPKLMLQLIPMMVTIIDYVDCGSDARYCCLIRRYLFVDACFCAEFTVITIVAIVW